MYEGPFEKIPEVPEPCLKNDKTPKRRIFFCRSALNFLPGGSPPAKIYLACLAKNFLPLSILPIFKQVLINESFSAALSWTFLKSVTVPVENCLVQRKNLSPRGIPSRFKQVLEL